MEIRSDALPRHLGGTLKFAYLLAGDEQLLVQEAADLLRSAARAQGFSERYVFDVNKDLDWADVRYEAQAMGLFASQKLIELRLSSGKLDAAGSELVQQWCEQPPEGVMLLMSCPEWKKDMERLPWFRALSAVGAHLIFWPIKREELPGWLVQRGVKLGIRLEQDAALALADRVEGNLLAAKQELEGLALQATFTGGASGPRLVSATDVAEFAADDARFVPATLADAVLLGDAERAVRVVRVLRAEGEEKILVLSAVLRQIELLYELALARQNGGSGAVARLYPMRGIWPARQRLYERALARAPLAYWQARLSECTQADQIAKGRAEGEPWLAIERLALRVALAPEQAARFMD